MGPLLVFQLSPIFYRHLEDRGICDSRWTLDVIVSAYLFPYGIPVMSCPLIQGIPRLSPRTAGIAGVTVRCLDEQ